MYCVFWFILSLAWPPLLVDSAALMPQGATLEAFEPVTNVGQIRQPRQQQQQGSTSTTPSPTEPGLILYSLDGTAHNVANILTGFANQDVRPILDGSLSFIPYGNIRGGVQQILQQISPGLQTLLFGTNLRSQPESATTQPPQTTTTTQPPSQGGPVQIIRIYYGHPESGEPHGTSTGVTTKPVVEVIYSPSTEPTTTPPQTEATTTEPTTTFRTTQSSYLKAEPEETTTEKEYVYLVLRPDEYDDLTKCTSKLKSEARNEMKQVETTTLPNLSLKDQEEAANFYLTHKNRTLTYYKPKLPKLPVKGKDDKVLAHPTYLNIKYNNEDDEDESRRRAGMGKITLKTYQDILNNS